MSRSRLYSTEAIVLRRNDYGEADRLLTLMTPHLGKLRVMAKGARKITSRKAGHIELFTRTNLLLAKGRTFDIVSQAELIETYRPLREDVKRGSLAHYFCELADVFGQEEHEDESLFNLFGQGLSWLSDAPDPKLAARHFELKLLTLSGYEPRLFRCALTDAPLEVDVNTASTQIILTTFSPQHGGALCNAAARQAREAVLLTPRALKLAARAANKIVRGLAPFASR
ncbi:MAG: DNA repair protein RecO [Anaerolineae bacterium]|nr:DNA repair protein RecO [Anaerolineae bacterium]